MPNWFSRTFVTIHGIGAADGRKKYPQHQDGIELPLFARGAVAPPTATQRFAAYEVARIEETRQWLFKAAAAVAPQLAGRRTPLAQIGHRMGETSREIASACADARALDEDAWQSPFAPAVATALMILSVAPEAPVNKLALDLLGVEYWPGWVLAGGLSLAMAVLAKFTARVLRHHPLTSRHAALAAGFNAVLVAALIAAAILRSSPGAIPATASSEISVSGVYAEDPAASAGSGGELAPPHAEAAGHTLRAFMVASLQGVLYAAAVALAYFQLAPTQALEQVHRRIATLRAALHRDWRARRPIAEAYNRDRVAALLTIAELEADCAERVADYRDGNLFEQTSAPAFLTQALTRHVFDDIDLGSAIDAHPPEIQSFIKEKHDDGHADHGARRARHDDGADDDGRTRDGDLLDGGTGSGGGNGGVGAGMGEPPVLRNGADTGAHPH